MSSSFLSSVAYSFSFVFITDLTDKSLFVIIILSQTLPALVLFTTSIISLLSVNFITILLGMYIPKLIAGIYMQIIACILFFTFGIITLKESTKEENSVENLIHRTRQELGELDANNDYKLMNDEIETNFESNNNDQIRLSSTLRSTSSSSENEKKNKKTNVGLIIAVALILCLSDLGDKSQITVFTMAAIYDIYGILIGSSLALLCTVTLAVLFGAWICEKISPKILLTFGGILFLIFGVQILLNIFFNWN